jgi:TRAP-type mannitol/chloroaromatic compound transport system substrate-binding protein
MDRRQFIQAGSVAATAGALAACGSGTVPTTVAGAQPSAAPMQWKMVTSWPTNFPGLGAGAARLAEMIGRMSGGRLTVKVFGGGELVPAFEVFDAVSQGTAEMGHSGAYYWKGKAEATQFFSAVPFGMNAQEMNGWLYHGGGLELWRELYAKFDLVPFPAGNTGVQLAGWFRKEINSVDDLKGLKMRIPGLGGEVLARLGGAPVNIPGAELYTAMQTGALDATEWVGPYNDLAFGLNKVAQYAYYPGWQEPGPTLECTVNKRAFEALPDDLKAIVEGACRAVNDDMLADYTAQNQRALETLIEAGVQFRKLPDDVLTALRETSDQVVAEIAAKDPFTTRVYDSYQAFRKSAKRWHEVSELAYYTARG